MNKTNQSKKYADHSTENNKIENSKAGNNRTDKNKTESIMILLLDMRVVRIWSRLQSTTMSASVPFTDTKRIMRK